MVAMELSMRQVPTFLGTRPGQPRGKSAISSLFSECVSLVDKLTFLSEGREKGSSETCALLDDHASKLRAWGNDTGASSWALDHSLRKASGLKQQVLLLLTSLKDELATALGATENLCNSANPAVLIFESVPIANDSETPKTLSSSSESKPKTMPSVADNITETLLCLRALVPALQDPTPQDTYGEDAVTKGELKDLNLAILMFPKASSKLIKRLGHANWKRRQIQRELRASRTQNRSLDERVVARPRPIDIPQEKAQVNQANLDIDAQRTVAYYASRHLQQQGNTFSAETSITGLMSISPATVFSDPSVFAGHSAISTMPSEGPTILKYYIVPDPPVDLRSDVEFTCPYCLQEIIVGEDIESTEDWEEHVFSDLEPYMCTFDDCIRADKTFGQRDEWFRHEIDSHRRVVKVWFCQTCFTEFSDGKGLEDHLIEVHRSTLRPDQLSIVVSMCQRKSQAPILDQACAICRFVCSDAEVLKDHVAVHFEQLSLTSINLEDGTEDDLALSQMNGGFQETELKKERLEAFLYELRENAFAKKHEVAEEGNHISTDSGSMHLADSSDDASLGRSKPDSVHVLDFMEPQRQIAKLEVETYRSKVERYLDEQSKNFHEWPESDLGSLRSFDLRSESMCEPAGPMETFRSIRTMPPTRNQAFVGRENDFVKLHEELSQNGRICVLSGSGGIGKSATAIEYSYKYEQEYAYIFWVQAETPVSCADSYGQIATHLGLNGDEVIRSQERLIILSRDFLERTGKRWLLVFDNVDDLPALQQFLPSDLLDTRGSILITTRNSSLLPASMRHSLIELGVLALEDCRRLLLTSTGENPKDMRTHPEYKLAGDIASYAGRLPLALSHIAGYLEQSGCSLEDFVELWQERLRHTTLHPPSKDGSSLNPTEKTLEIMWNIGLREVTIDARELLNILAFLDSDTIQKDLLVDEHHEVTLEFLHSSERFRYKRMTSELARRRLIAIKAEDGQDTLSIHRALQLKILKDLDKDPQNREKVFRQAYMLVRKKFPSPSPIQIPEPHKWPIYIKYIPHILALRKAFTDSVITLAPSAEFARLLSDGGMSLWERAWTNESLQLLKSAETILEQVKDSEDMLIANINVIIGIIIEGQGFTHIPESLQRFQRALDIRLEYKKRTPPELYTKNDDILLYNVRSDYACCLLQQNRYFEAEPIFKSCLTKYREWGSEEEIPYEYSKYNQNMAWCSMYRRDFNNAVKLAERSVHYIKLATGQSPSTNSWKFTMGCIVLQSGDTKRALDIHKEVLEARIQQHGTSNYLTSQSYYAVGALHAMTADLPTAESYMRKALGHDLLRRETYPEVAVARVQFHLSQILCQQDKNLDEARDLITRSRTVLNKLLPLNPLDGVPEKHELALFDHLQPLFAGARFTGRLLLQYIK